MAAAGGDCILYSECIQRIVLQEPPHIHFFFFCCGFISEHPSSFRLTGLDEDSLEALSTVLAVLLLRP